jgi:hypothetical protein
MISTNLLVKGEVSPERLLAVKERTRGPLAALHSPAAKRGHGVVEDGMVGQRRELSRESLAEAASAFMAHEGPKNRCREAVRAPVRVRKRGNARGAKGCRKMEA